MYSSLYLFKLVHNKLKENFSLFGLAGQQCIVARGDVRAHVGQKVGLLVFNDRRLWQKGFPPRNLFATN